MDVVFYNEIPTLSDDATTIKIRCGSCSLCNQGKPKCGSRIFKAVDYNISLAPFDDYFDQFYRNLKNPAWFEWNWGATYACLPRIYAIMISCIEKFSIYSNTEVMIL